MTEQTPLEGLDHITAAADGAIVAAATAAFASLADLDEASRIETINAIRLALAQHSPMRAEPVDCVLWVEADQVSGNDYNPNVVAPPEMALLALSIAEDGYTQPVVAWQTGSEQYEVVDGFHRHRVGKEVPEITERVKGRLPIAVINGDREAVTDRKAATVRHNRARGEHTVEGMSAIVVDLAQRGKPDEWIATHLGMDPDEVTRLRQLTGIAAMFADEDFSEAWEAAEP